MWPRPLRLLGCLEVDPGPGSALWLCWHSYRAPASCWHGYRALAWWLGRSCFWNGAEGVLSCPGYCLSRLPGQALIKSAVSGGELPASRAGHPAGWRFGGAVHGMGWLPGDRLSLSFTAANPLLCSTARYHCKNGLCIDKSFICDGQNNCQDNSDEESCESSQGRRRPALTSGRTSQPRPTVTLGGRTRHLCLPPHTRTVFMLALDPTALAHVVLMRSTIPFVFLVLNSICTFSQK